MGYDPKEPRDKSGKWFGGASGHNAGKGNRDIASKIKSHFVELPPKMRAEVDAHKAKVSSHPNFRVVDANSKLTSDYIKLRRKYVVGH